MKVLLVASEAYPFIKTGGIGYTAGFLPKALRKKDIDIRVVIPKYKNLDADIKKKLNFIKWYTVKLGWRNQYCGVLEYEKDNVIYYLLDNEYYFNRDSEYGYDDDAERFAFFDKATLNLIEEFGW